MAGHNNLFAADVNGDDNGDSSVVKWKGGHGKFWGNGTFGSGTITLKYSFDGTNYYDVQVSGSAITFTATGIKDFSMPACLLRATLAGATNPAINAGVAPLQ